VNIKKTLVLFILLIVIPLFAETTQSSQNVSPFTKMDYQAMLSTPDGFLYSYIVLIFSNNPHFLNIINNDDFSSLDNSDYLHLFEKYKAEIRDEKLNILLNSVYTLAVHPEKMTNLEINEIERKLEEHKIIAKFVREENTYILDYCIFGKRKKITIQHPFLISKHDIYTIEPLIQYDEFFSSNSTFYHDLIYIDDYEVENDSHILNVILEGKTPEDLYYVGAKITDDIKTCTKKSFPSGGDTKHSLKRIFIIHELTHKIINTRYGYYNSIVEEELAIASTIYDNPYLGLSVVYSYLNYNYTHSPHRIAALKFLRFTAEDTDDTSFLYNPSKLKMLSADQLRYLAYRYFYSRMKLVETSQKKTELLLSEKRRG
jgi:hypothetical protein